MGESTVDSFFQRKVTRRSVNKNLVKGAGAALTATIVGRGAYETGSDVYQAGKETVEEVKRAYKSVAFWAHKSPGAIQVFEGGVLVEPLKKQSKNEFGLVFHYPEKDSQKKKDAAKLVREMRVVIATNPDYQSDMLFKVTDKHSDFISKTAGEYGVDSNLAIGVVFVENGGGEARRNEVSGATGVAQLMPDAAKRYGLSVDPANDERKNPQKSIVAMCQYLRDLNNEFLDQGLAVWGYHAGEGNVYEGLRTYFMDIDDNDYGDPIEGPQAVQSAESYRKLIRERNLTVHDVLQNPRVKKEFLSTLKDESELYIYKVVAASQLYRIDKEML